MANQQPARLVHARHVFRKDADGNAVTKAFPRRVWDRLPKIQQWVDGQKVDHPKMGWVETPAEAGTPAPEPLKAPKQAKAVASKDGGIQFV